MKKYEFGVGFEVEAGLGGSIAMLMLPHYLSDRIQAWAKDNIADDELYGKKGKGREKSPHITLQNGIIAEDPQEVYSVLKNMPPVGVRLGEMSIFRNKGREYDVVKIDVSSPDNKLNSMNNKVRASLEINDPYGGFNPHVTVAYVKRGLGNRFAGLKPFLGDYFVSDTLLCAGGGFGQRIFHLKGEEAPLKESVDYGLSVAAMQDLESYLLDSGKSMSDISKREAAKIIKELSKE